MKKFLVSLIAFVAVIASVQAQSVVVVERPGLFTDLATAIVGVPAAAATGIVSGTINAVGNLVSGSTVVYPTVPSAMPIVVPAPVVQPTIVQTAPPVVRTPVVVSPVVPTVTITTSDYSGTVSVTRPASGYEYGNYVVPVPPSHRVGPGVGVNPYVFRYR